MKRATLSALAACFLSASLLAQSTGAAGENVLANDPRAGIVDPPGGL